MLEVIGSTPISSTIRPTSCGTFYYMSFYVYILYSVKLDKYYTGSCQDILIRLQQHNTGRNISTKTGIPWVLKYTETFDSRAEAFKREMQIKKKKSRNYIEWTISSTG